MRSKVGGSILARLPGSWRRREESLIRQLVSLGIGVPQQSLEDEDIGDISARSQYSDAYVRLQRARARAFLEDEVSPMDAQMTRAFVLLGVPPDVAEEARFLRSTGDHGVKLALDVLTEAWRTDAEQGLWRLRSLRFMPLLLLAPVVFVLFLQLVPDLSAGLAALTGKFVMVPVFGFLGASLSRWLDRSRPPRSIHWAAVWQAMNNLRLVGGAVIGFAISYFSPLLVPASTSTEQLLPTLYLLAMAFGFSQDAFFSKLQGVAADESFSKGNWT